MKAIFDISANKGQNLNYFLDNVELQPNICDK